MVWASDIEMVPYAELVKAKEVFAATGDCTCHTMRRSGTDTAGIPYIRSCTVCGKHLGYV